MHKIDRKTLSIAAARQRKEIAKPKLEELKESIKSIGLLHAPIARPLPEGGFELIAGERRTRAIDLLAAEGFTFTYNLTQFEPGFMPVVLLSEAITALQRSEAEFAENVVREDLPWQDRVEALAYMHKLRQAENPKQTLLETAREILAAAPEGGSDLGISDRSVASEAHLRNSISQATVIARHLDDPTIAKARNATEAYNLIIQKEERAFTAELIRRGQKKITTIEVRYGSLLEILPKLDAGQFDTICCDPPYGINVNSAGFRSRTVHHHNYEDSPDVARELISCILTEGFRVCRPRANLFMFCDIDLFGWFKENCLRAGWEPFRTPITWGKSDSEGMAPWGREGFRRTVEWIFFARKGQKGLFHSPIDYLRHNRVRPDEREYGAEKPVSLLKELLAASTLPGEYVLDPCCGSGSTLAAARELNMRALGIEVDEAAYNIALVKSQRDGTENL